MYDGTKDWRKICDGLILEIKAGKEVPKKKTFTNRQLLILGAAIFLSISTLLIRIN